MGPNMLKLFAVASANWSPLAKGRDNSRALVSLVKAGKLQQRTTDGVVQFALANGVKADTTKASSTKPKAATAPSKVTAASTAPKRTPRILRPTADGQPRETKLQQALNIARATPGITRPDLVKALRTDLKMTEKGASTYASSVLKSVKK